jgi:tRNA pseudouridine55 synthase
VPTSLHGVLVIDKPRGLTSADVVARVKRALRSPSVGHTGTLDPLATGVLPVVVGEGTKLAPLLLADDKEYEGELELGITTDTLDGEGTVVARAPADGVTAAAVAGALAAWVGAREQIPPAHSALRVGGRRAYELARRGDLVEIPARPIRIDRFELLGFEAPRARFRVACGKGTYVRALVRDVGAGLGCGATLTALRRTRAGSFTLADAQPLDHLDPAAPGLIPPPRALAHLAAIDLDAAGLVAVGHGRRLPAPADATPGQMFRLLTPSGDLAAVAQVEANLLSYVRVFLYGLTGT